jgi:hypothetical protein
MKSKFESYSDLSEHYDRNTDVVNQLKGIGKVI